MIADLKILYDVGEKVEYALRTFNLYKKIKGNVIINDLNINVKKGEIYGLLGQNGSGKTTTLKLIVNLLKPTSGVIEFFNEPIRNKNKEFLKKIGSVIEYPAFYENLTARENLQIHKTLMGYEEKNCIDDAIGMVKLKNFEGKLVSELSLGTKQKLGIARAILTKPDLLILDEPINSLDPLGIRDIRNLLGMISKKYGTTILIASHILSEIEQIADTIGIIHKGTLLEEIDYESIREKSRHSIELIVDDVNKASFLLSEKMNINNFLVFGLNKIKIYERLNDSGRINVFLCKNNVEVKSVNIKRDTLEEHFVSLIGESQNV
ncbi:daunorubicin/doxorubicin resistance ATP-binding protein DrrA [Clostridium magnum DSM 2767]|uniref:Daunorubicin/doxorubicin resistance ATP-binding protein DrrA n=1 Tax=Clostridium magnum DSM 2767 TaxID=1121326 RepID=A0A162RQH8_9CLOT|nr:daunorubicin/doxorubicin resistance ATP-binding protein DrrA [Clostridium magnum DSM 2767]SHI13907.1 ABC-2 type transport system ATP-binding protein [Clostridium magnum DSM 2767]